MRKDTRARKIAGVIGAVLAVGSLLAACTSGPSSDPSSSSTQSGDAIWDRIEAEKSIKVGIFNQAPYGYLTADGEVAGESIDTLRAALATYGIDNIEAEVVEFSALVPGLAAGRFDAIAAGLYVNPERCEQVAFGTPTLKMGETFLVHTGNPKNLHSYADVVADSTARLGVTGGSAEFKFARDAGIPEGQIVVFADNGGMVAGLKANRVDAIGITVGTAANLMMKDPDSGLEIAEPFDSVLNGEELAGYGAVAFNKSATVLLEKFNSAIESLRASGELVTVMENNNLSAKEVAPTTVTVEQLCAG